jgi:CRISPR-associated DxTHG motif protein
MGAEREIGPTLVTVLGTESHEVDYVLDGRSCKAPLAPLAIVQLRGGVGEVVALCTKDAEAATYPLLQGRLPPELSVRSEAIPEVTSQDETEAFLRKVIQVLVGREVILDLTHGLRHLAALAFLTAVYLSALERVHIVGVYYGLLRRGAPSPLLELRPLLELVTLAFAAEHLRRTGSPAVLIDRIKNDHSKEAEMIASQLVAVAGSYASGLPLRRPEGSLPSLRSPRGTGLARDGRLLGSPADPRGIYRRDPSDRPAL